MGMLLRRREPENNEFVKSDYLPKRRGVDDVETTSVKDEKPQTVKRQRGPRKAVKDGKP